MIRRNFVGVVRRGAGCWEWRWDVCCVRLLEEQGQGRDNEMTDDVEMLSLPVTACQFPHKPFANVDLTRPAPRVLGPVIQVLLPFYLVRVTTGATGSPPLRKWQSLPKPARQHA